MNSVGHSAAAPPRARYIERRGLILAARAAWLLIAILAGWGLVAGLVALVVIAAGLVVP